MSAPGPLDASAIMHRAFAGAATLIGALRCHRCGTALSEGSAVTLLNWDAEHGRPPSGCRLLAYCLPCYVELGGSPSGTVQTSGNPWRSR